MIPIEPKKLSKSPSLTSSGKPDTNTVSWIASSEIQFQRNSNLTFSNFSKVNSPGIKLSTGPPK